MQCRLCETEKLQNDFYPRNRVCKMCQRAKYVKKKDDPAYIADRECRRNSAYQRVLQKAQERRRESTELFMWRNARARANRKAIPFTIEVSDIIIPTLCPILGFSLAVNHGVAQKNSPSLGRILPELGYVKGNVWVISHLANSMKTDAGMEAIRKFSTWGLLFATGYTH